MPHSTNSSPQGLFFDSNECQVFGISSENRGKGEVGLERHLSNSAVQPYKHLTHRDTPRSQKHLCNEESIQRLSLENSVLPHDKHTTETCHWTTDSDPQDIFDGVFPRKHSTDIQRCMFHRKEGARSSRNSLWKSVLGDQERWSAECTSDTSLVSNRASCYT